MPCCTTELSCPTRWTSTRAHPLALAMQNLLLGRVRALLVNQLLCIDVHVSWPASLCWAWSSRTSPNHQGQEFELTGTVYQTLSKGLTQALGMQSLLPGSTLVLLDNQLLCNNGPIPPVTSPGTDTGAEHATLLLGKAASRTKTDS